MKAKHIKINAVHCTCRMELRSYIFAMYVAIAHHIQSSNCARYLVFYVIEELYSIQSGL